MSETDINQLLKNLLSIGKENERIEFKENNLDLLKIGERISGLSNSANYYGKPFGYLIFGVKDDSLEIVGTNIDLEKHKEGNEPIYHRFIQRLSPKISPQIYDCLVDGKKVVIIEIPAARDRPVAFSLIEYIRIGSITRKLADFPDIERKIWYNPNNKNFEKEIALSNLSIDNVLELLDYPNYFRLTKQPLLEKKGIIEKFIQEFFIIQNPDSSYNITNLGAILWAFDISNFPSIRRKGMRVILYKGNNRIETIREQSGIMGYAVGFLNIISYIESLIPSNEAIKKALRVEETIYPDIAIRELIANALIHQDFSEHGNGPMVEIFSDRMEISNPGKPLINIDRFLDHAPKSRNEDLAAFMRRIGVCEERGSGIDKVVSFIELYQLPAPKFEEQDNYIKVTLFTHKKHMSVDDKVRACYWHSCLKYMSNDFLTNTSVRERFGIKNSTIASRIINETVKKGLIKLSDPNGKAPKYYKYIPIRA